MNRFFWILCLLIYGCSSRPENLKKVSDKSFKYCGGMQGHMTYIPNTMNKEKFFQFAVYISGNQSLHADKFLPLTIAFTGIDPLEVKMDPVSVEIEGSKSDLKPSFRIFKEAHDINHFYPATEYNHALIDAKSNKWQVLDKNHVFLLWKKAKVVQLPFSETSLVKDADISASIDQKKFERFFVYNEILNVWPKNKSLTNTEVIVSLPAMKVNGQDVPAKQLKLPFSYSVLKEKQKSFTRCPSLEEVFRFNR